MRKFWKIRKLQFWLPEESGFYRKNGCGWNRKKQKGKENHEIISIKRKFSKIPKIRSRMQNQMRDVILKPYQELLGKSEKTKNE